MDEPDDRRVPITGIGKTLGMTGYAYKDHLKKREIWSNFYTTFSTKIIGFQEMINLIMQSVENNAINPNLILVVTEMRKILDAVGSSKDQMLFIDNFSEQIRKLECSLYWDTQRFNSIQKRLRLHTNTILIPYKVHYPDLNNEEVPCNLPSCMKPHKIYIFSHEPYVEEPIKCFNSIAVGKLYNTKEFCWDKLVLPKKIKGEY
jgi:hypothetical protein